MNYKRWICAVLCILCLCGWAFAYSGEIDTNGDGYLTLEEIREAKRRSAERAEADRIAAEAEAEAKRIAEENFAKEYEKNMEADRTRAERNAIIQNCVLLGVGVAVCGFAVVVFIKANRRETK